MDHFVEMMETLKQTLDEDFGDSIVQRTQKHFEEHQDRSSLDNIIFREVVTSEAFSRLQNSLCIDLTSRNKYGRHSSHGTTQKEASCTCMLGSPVQKKASALINVILESLHCTALACKLQALDSLINLISVEQMSLSNWELCEVELQASLLHPVSAISDASLTVYVTALCSSSPLIVKESYCSLLKTAFQVLCALKQPDANFSVAYNSANVVINFQKCISKHWLRYPEELVVSLIEETFQCYAVQPSDNIFLVYGLIDPCSLWLYNWLYCKLSRTIIFTTLDKHKHLIVHLLRLCMTTADEMNENKPLQVSQAATFLMNLASYEQGYRLIAEAMENTEESGNFLVLLLHITANLGKTIICDYFKGMFLKIFHLSVTYKMMEGNGNCKNITSSMANVISSDNDISMHLMSSCLEKISVTEKGKHLLLCSHSILIALKQHVITTLSLEGFCHENGMVCLNVLGNLLSHTKGVENILEEKLINILCEHLSNFEVLDFIFRVLSHPLGTYYFYLNILEAKITDVALVETCKFIQRKLHSVCSCKRTRDYCKLLNLLLVKLNDIEMVHEIYRGLFAIKEQVCFCCGLNSVCNKILLTLSFYLESYIGTYLKLNGPERTSCNLILPLLEKECPCLICSKEVMLLLLCMCGNNFYVKFCLESMFGTQDYLTNHQTSECEGGKLHVTQNTLILNHLFIKTQITGGPTERIVPSKNYINEEHEYAYFTTSSVSPEVVTNARYNTVKICENCLFGETICNLNSLKNFLLGDLQVECKNNAIHFSALESFFDSITLRAMDSFTVKNSGLQDYGTQKAIDYGIFLNLLSSDISVQDHQENLCKLMHFACTFYPGDLKNASVPFDFLTATIYIIAAGKEEFARKLITLSNEKNGNTVSFGEMYRFLLVDEPSFKKGKVCLFFDTIVEEILPHVSSKLVHCGIRPSNLLMYWTGQIFWNCLDFEDISFFVLLSIMCGAEYSLYFSVALLKNFEAKILGLHNICDVHFCLLHNPIKGFSALEEMPFVNRLHLQYKGLYETLMLGFNDSRKTM